MSTRTDLCIWIDADTPATDLLHRLTGAGLRLAQDQHGDWWLMRKDASAPAAALSVGTLLLQAQALLHDAGEANRTGDPATFELQRQARELIGAAIDAL